MKIFDLNTLFEAQQELFEVEMSPSNLKRLASAIPDARVGMEFEMIVPDVQSEDMDDYEPEEDMDQDERAEDIDDIVRFFSSDDDYMGQANDPSDLRNLEEELREKFYEWQSEQIDQEWNSTDGKEFFAKWCHDNVDPDDVADHVDKAEDLLGDRIPDSDDWEKFIDDEWAETFDSDNYQNAYDEFREEKIDEDFSELQFLREIGISHMSDVNNNIRGYIRWPFYSQPDYGSGGMAIEDVADEFSEAIGKRVYSSTSYHGARRSEDAYSLEPDSSIETSDSSEAGLEFISPPMSVEEMIEDLDDVRQWAVQRGAYTNKSTGLHINVSVPNYSRDNLDYVKLAILMGDKYVLEKFSRYGSGWARSALDIVKERAADRPEEVDSLLKQVKNGVESIASKVIHSGRTDKYTSINTKDGYVEFRSAGGDWLGSQYDKIQDTILRFVVALDAACDPNKYKKEYLKGLYKVLKPKDPKSDMSMFARYMAGEITKSELTNTLEKTRKERFRGQGIAVIDASQAEEGDWVVEYDDGMKQETIYLVKSDAVPTDEAAFNAAKKFKPQWFRPDTIEYITVKPFQFDEELNDLNLYRAEYGHKYTSVVAPDEEIAKQNVKIIDADYFAHYPDTEITLNDEQETSKRKILQILEWQRGKMKIGEEWLARPKIWRATGNSRQAGRYYIAAASRDEAADIVARLDPQMFSDSRFELYVNDAYPDANTYEAYIKAQNDMIQQYEEERAAQEREQEAPDVDVSNLHVYRVSSSNGYLYVVGKNGSDAAAIACKLDPEKFPSNDVADLTVERKDEAVGPDMLKAMYNTQEQTLNSNRDLSRGQTSEDKLFDVRRVNRGGAVFVAATTEEEAKEIASLIYPGFRGEELAAGIYQSATPMQINRIRQQQEQELASSMGTERSAVAVPSEFSHGPASDWQGELRGRLGNAQPAFSQPSRISDLQRYLVSRTDASGLTNIAATSEEDAIQRAMAQNPTWNPRMLTVRRLGDGEF